MAQLTLKNRKLFHLAIFIQYLITACVFAEMSYLDNGIIKIGVNLDLGGAITYIADSNDSKNIVNNHDWGRQIQMSFYGYPKPYEPNGKKPRDDWHFLGWNPIQSGDCYRNRSKLIDHKNNGKQIYVECIPMHWPLNNEPANCTFQCWITLKDNTAHIRSKINNRRRNKNFYPARGTEQPAIYTNGTHYRLMTYAGDKPFTNDTLTQITKSWIDTDLGKGPVWDTWLATENWAALLGDNDHGLGIWEKGVYIFHGGYFGLTKGTGGTLDPQTGYIAPYTRDILDHNIQYEYNYVLILDSLDNIRKYVYDNTPKDTLPNYHFAKDRQHWYYQDCSDTGWPVKKHLEIITDVNTPIMFGPHTFFHSKDVPKLYIKAKYPKICSKTEKTATARIYFKPFTGKENLREYTFQKENSVSLDINMNGKWQVYEVDLSSSTAYKGCIIQLRFDILTNNIPKTNKPILIEYIRTSPKKRWL